MPYTINMPLATDFISASQSLINENFTEIQAWGSVDHSPLGSAAGTLDGFHYKTTFVPQYPPGFPATPTFPVGYPGLFSANPASMPALPVQPLTGLNEIFIKIQTGIGTFNVFPVTASIVADSTIITQGYFYLPGGLIVKYGTSTMAAANPIGTSTNYTVGANYPVFNPAVGVSLFTFPIGTSAGVPVVMKSIIGLQNNLQFTVQAYNSLTGLPIGAFNFYFLAIGSI